MSLMVVSVNKQAVPGITQSLLTCCTDF